MITILTALGHLTIDEKVKLSHGPEIPQSLEFPALLVYTGHFESIKGPVEITEAHVKRIVERRNSILSKVKRLASGDVPMKFCPPVQLDHSDSAAVTVGRLVGNVMEGEYLVDGETVPRKAIYGNVRMLGRDNVERALDGRFTHLSIGADLETGDFSELTITPFPAAAEASFLKSSKVTIFSKGDGEMDKEKLKHYLTSVKKMSEKDADEKLAKCSPEEMSALAKENEEHEAKMAAEEKEKEELSNAEDGKNAGKGGASAGKGVEEEAGKAGGKAGEGPAAMSANRDKLIQLATDFRASAKGAQLEKKKGSILVKLSKLQASAKLTPAERKKIDLDKLAVENDATVEAVLKSYEDREPVIHVGIYGSVKAGNLAELQRVAKKTEKVNLKKEVMGDMTLLKDRAKGVTLSDEGITEPVEKVEADPKNTMSAMMKAVLGYMEAGQWEQAHQTMKSCMELAGQGGTSDGVEAPPDYETHMSALATSVEKMQNQFEEFVKLTGVEAAIK